jgi:hypothetical protein
MGLTRWCIKRSQWCHTYGLVKSHELRIGQQAAWAMLLEPAARKGHRRFAGSTAHSWVPILSCAARLWLHQMALLCPLQGRSAGSRGGTTAAAAAAAGIAPPLLPTHCRWSHLQTRCREAARQLRRRSNLAAGYLQSADSRCMVYAIEVDQPDAAAVAGRPLACGFQERGHWLAGAAMTERRPNGDPVVASACG